MSGFLLVGMSELIVFEPHGLAVSCEMANVWDPVQKIVPLELPGCDTENRRNCLIPCQAPGVTRSTP